MYSSRLALHSSAQSTTLPGTTTNPISSPQPLPQTPNRAKRLASPPTPSSRLRSPLARISTTLDPYFSRPACVQSTHSSTHLTSIGNLLSTPYDSDSEDEVLTPHHSRPLDRPRSGTVQKYLGIPKIVRSHVSRTQVGEIDDDLDGDVIAFDRPGPVPPTKTDWRQSNESGILIYPSVSIPLSPLRYPAPTRPPLLTPPATPTHRLDQVSTPMLATPRSITPLSVPPNASPISPLLAAPPQPHFNSISSPSSPFSTSDNRSSISSDSTWGYQIMLEKKALFRGGDELISPFAMSTEALRQESRLRHHIRAGSSAFSRRFSAAYKSDQIAHWNRCALPLSEGSTALT